MPFECCISGAAKQTLKQVNSGLLITMVTECLGNKLKEMNKAVKPLAPKREREETEKVLFSVQLKC